MRYYPLLIFAPFKLPMSSKAENHIYLKALLPLPIFHLECVLSKVFGLINSHWTQMEMTFLHNQASN